MKKLLTFAIAMAFISCGGTPTNNTSSDATDASSASKTPKTAWRYSENVNEMDDTKTQYARLDANEELEFSFPYNGGTEVWLTIRKQSDKTSLMLCIPKDKGQFVPAAMGDKAITVRFDDKPAEKYSYTDPSDFSMNVIFISNSQKFISNLKNSKTLLIQCEFFNEGIQTMKFKSEGLVWDK